MTEQKGSKPNSYFDKPISLCEDCNKKMQADDRTDEAAFEGDAEDCAR